MKKINLLLISVLLLSKIPAQDYQINFEGVGAASFIDSVHVNNITQGTSITISGSDILHLTGAVGIEQNNPGINKGLRLFPNPMNTYCTIEFYVPETSPASIKIYDILGKNTLSSQ